MVCVGQSLWSGFLVFGWACEDFLGCFLPSVCGLSGRVLLSYYCGDCLVSLIFLVFLGPWEASATFLGLRGFEPRGWLFVCFFMCLDIPW